MCGVRLNAIMQGFGDLGQWCAPPALDKNCATGPLAPVMNPLGLFTHPHPPLRPPRGFPGIFRSTRVVFATLLLLGAAACNPVFAQANARVSAQEHPITLRIARADSGPIRPGGVLWLRLQASIPSGWHLYGVTQPPGGPIATSFAFDPEKLFQLGADIDAPVPRYVTDPNFGLTSAWHEDSAIFRLPILVAVEARGKQKLIARVTYQTCTTRYCLPPREDTLSLSVTISGEPVAGQRMLPAANAFPLIPLGTAIPVESATSVTNPDSIAGSATTRTAAGSQSVLLFLWAALWMGALALLTPCVFPMVPITISYFGRRQGKRGSAIAEAALYSFGIVGAFTLLGVGASLLFGVAGLSRLAANAWLNVGIGMLFVVFALSLFGVVQIAVPSRLLTALDSAARRSRFGRAGTTLLMGGTFALTTFTCTAPFVGTLLVSAAAGDWRLPALGLLFFSSAFALPFFVLALVPRALTRLPRSGEWLVTLKVALAFIELAAAMKFFSNADLVEGWGILPRQVVLGVWVVLAVLLALYLLGVRAGRWYVRHGALEHPVAVHPVATTAVLLTVVWLATGLAGKRMGELESFLPPAGAAQGGYSTNELEWMTDDFDAAVARARSESKLVLIDFTGFTCTNCRWMEANMFPRQAVQDELEKFVRVRLFTDGSSDKHRLQQRFEQDRFNTVALPLYAVVDGDGVPRATFLGMTRDAGEFLRFLVDARRTAP